MLHIVLHFLLPLLVARLAFKQQWLRAYSIMMLTMLVDLDHLLADPIYDPYRCSIDFHPLHQFEIMPLYLLLIIPKRTRLIGLGLCIHMLLDFQDCVVMKGGFDGLPFV